MKRAAMNACDMLEPVSEAEREVYRGIRDTIIKAHCSAPKDKKHRCLGSITITHNTITMICPLCGDSRGILEN